MVLTEQLDPERFREEVKVYATDLDEDALNRGRRASFSAKEVEAVPESLRERYFEVDEGSFTFRKDLRRSIIFGHHDLVQDAPISRIDLLICRNTLMYFNAETQARVVRRFDFALKDAGFLFLGKSEMLPAGSNFFSPVELKHRIFTKGPRVSIPPGYLTTLQSKMRIWRRRAAAGCATPVSRWVSSGSSFSTNAARLFSRTSRHARCSVSPSRISVGRSRISSSRIVRSSFVR